VLPAASAASLHIRQFPPPAAFPPTRVSTSHARESGWHALRVEGLRASLLAVSDELDRGTRSPGGSKGRQAGATAVAVELGEHAPVSPTVVVKARVNSAASWPIIESTNQQHLIGLAASADPHQISHQIPESSAGGRPFHQHHVEASRRAFWPHSRAISSGFAGVRRPNTSTSILLTECAAESIAAGRTTSAATIRARRPCFLEVQTELGRGGGLARPPAGRHQDQWGPLRPFAQGAVSPPITSTRAWCIQLDETSDSAPHPRTTSAPTRPCARFDEKTLITSRRHIVRSRARRTC